MTVGEEMNGRSPPFTYGPILIPRMGEVCEVHTSCTGLDVVHNACASGVGEYIQNVWCTP